MTEEVRNKLRSIYDYVTEKGQRVIQVFVDQFSEELVDNTLYSFNEFFEWLSRQTLGSLGINRWTDSNNDGSYVINREDYEANGRGKNFLEYIPDLGIIDYLSEPLARHIFEEIQHRKIQNDSRSDFDIIIRFPEVKVSNEYDKFVIIKELYVKVDVSLQGKILRRFQMVRSEFTAKQYLSDYAHSHLSGISQNFMEPCTGSGPINDTIRTLQNRYDLDIWGLFAFELAKYVTVESIAGTPYRRLENIGNNNCYVLPPELKMVTKPPYNNGLMNREDYIAFIKYFLSLGQMKISYQDGVYKLGESWENYWIKVSNAFIDWYNNHTNKTASVNTLARFRILSKYIVSQGIVYKPTIISKMERVAHLEGIELFMFKGETVKLHFTNDVNLDNIVWLVNVEVCQLILTKALQIINYNYGRTDTEETKDDSRCYYI